MNKKLQSQTQWVKIAELQEHPENYNTHPDSQIKDLQASLDLFSDYFRNGQFKNVVVCQGKVLAGNGVVEAARRNGIEEIEAIVNDDLPEELQRALIVADNALPFGAIPDNSKLNRLLSNVGELTIPGVTQDWLSSVELTDLLGGQTDPTLNDEAADLIPEVEEEPITKLGELWQLGNHRLLCGDSTKQEDVERLLNGQKADLCFTSPPYNAGNSKTGAYNGSNLGRTDFKKMYASDFDDMDSESYKTFLWSVLQILAAVSTEETPILWNVGYNAKSRFEYGEIVFSDKNPFGVKETIVWDKGLGMNIAASGILSRTAELIFLMSKGKRYFTNQKPTDVWWNMWRVSNRDGDNMQNKHGASFPVALVQEALAKFSKINANVVEPFGGSGTTMIACEQANRKCFSMEISPLYCTVSIRRWEKYTGKQATLIE